jgi:hypothetical protein
MERPAFARQCSPLSSQRSSEGWDGGEYGNDLGLARSEIFLRMGLDRGIKKLPDGQISLVGLKSFSLCAQIRGTGETVRRAQSVHPLNASSVPSFSVTDAINADTAIGSCRRLGYSTLSPWLVR